MIRRNDVDRAFVDWIGEQDRARATYLDEILAVTERTRQRPAWSFPERWIPVQLTLQRVAVPRATAYLVLLAILLALAVAAVVLVGTQRRLPTPFGPAANGLVAHTSHGGDIVLLDPRTGESTTLVGGPERDSLPAFSLDGTRVAFVRASSGAETVHVVDAAGGQPTPVTSEPMTDVAQLAWSPDGRQLAFVAGAESSRRIWLASADGSTAARELPTGMSADNVAWRPPDGREIVFRGTTTPGTGYRLYLASADGTNTRALPPVAGSDVNDYAPAFSPDGERIFYVRWGSDLGRVYAFDVAGGRETDIGPKDGRSVAAFQVSPAGDRVSLAMPVLIDTGPLQIAVADVEGARSVVDTGPEFKDIATLHRWSPDGTSILAWRPADGLVMELDPAGGSPRTLTWPTLVDPDWQRVAP